MSNPKSANDEEVYTAYAIDQSAKILSKKFSGKEYLLSNAVDWELAQKIFIAAEPRGLVVTVKDKWKTWKENNRWENGAIDSRLWERRETFLAAWEKAKQLREAKKGSVTKEKKKEVYEELATVLVSRHNSMNGAYKWPF